MANTLKPSNWLQATAMRAREIEEALECPKCHAMNRPSAIIVELDARSWTACCGCCAHSWPVDTGTAS